MSSPGTVSSPTKARGEWLTSAPDPQPCRRLTIRLSIAAAVLIGAISAMTLTLAAQPQLGPTAHPPLPRTESEYWLVPSAGDRRARGGKTSQELAEAVQRYQAGDHAAARRILDRLPRESAIADYADYYRGLVLLRLKQVPEAKAILDRLVARTPEGALATAAALAQAEAAEAFGEPAAAAAIYRRLASDKQTADEDVLSRLGRAALAAGDRKTAAEAYLRVYYEYPLTDAATAAASHLATLQDQIVRTGYAHDLGRAQMLFGARRYAEARSAFQELQTQATGDDRELVDLRVAEADFYLKRYEAARDALRPYLEGASRAGEAQFFYLSAIRELGGHDEFVSRTRALVAAFPNDYWAQEALNNLGTHYILTNQDAEAAAVFAELYEKFPTGPRAERAAWKAGWWSYRTGDHAAAIRIFESAAAAFPRSDYRPSFLYWSARAHKKLGNAVEADARFRLVVTDYGNSYYGRLARRHISGGRGAGGSVVRGIGGSEVRRGGGARNGGTGESGRAAGEASRDRPTPVSHQPPAAAARRPPTTDRIRLLLAHGLYDDALAELRHAQRAWGTSPAIEATIAWAHHQKGELRRAITLMRRAYPQSLTSEGHELPVEIRQILFPLAYWDLIRKHASIYELDPYVIAALIGQESTFDPEIRSSANAIGLMQIVPATGRRLAVGLRIRSFHPRRLTHPETNIRLGTLYFARLVRQFNGLHYALASYNAGENRVERWKAERAGLDEDEFIDDIPYPETQNYVKRILGTAEDYRILYGRDGGRPLAATR